MSRKLRERLSEFAVLDKSDIVVLAEQPTASRCFNESAGWNYMSDDPEEYINWFVLLLDNADNP